MSSWSCDCFCLILSKRLCLSTLNRACIQDAAQKPQRTTPNLNWNAGAGYPPPDSGTPEQNWWAGQSIWSPFSLWRWCSWPSAHWVRHRHAVECSFGHTRAEKKEKSVWEYKSDNRKDSNQFIELHILCIDFKALDQFLVTGRGLPHH